MCYAALHAPTVSSFLMEEEEKVLSSTHYGGQCEAAKQSLFISFLATKTVFALLSLNHSMRNSAVGYCPFFLLWLPHSYFVLLTLPKGRKGKGGKNTFVFPYGSRAPYGAYTVSVGKCSNPHLN